MGEDINAPHPLRGDTPLHIAVQYGNNEITKFLLKKGAQIDRLDCSGMAPIHHVAFSGNIEILQMLVEERGADVNQLTMDSETAIFFTLSKGYEVVFFFLLDHGADYNLRDIHGGTLLHRAARKTRNIGAGENFPSPEIVRKLLDLGINVNSEDKYKATPLYWALKTAASEEIVLLLKRRGGLFWKTAMNDSCNPMPRDPYNS